jgi:uncharacterized membrane protein YidH (DUF202 family)
MGHYRYNNMKKNITAVGFVIAFCFVLFAVTGFAQSVLAAPLMNSSSNLSGIIFNIRVIFNSLIPLLIGAAVIVFLYGILRFISKSTSGNAEDRKESINFMIWGIVGIAVMVSIWGLVAFVTNTLGTTTSVTPQFSTSGL